MTDYSPAQRKKLAAQKKAMPGGRFPIANLADLRNAKIAVGRSNTPTATRAFINEKAREMGAPPLGQSGAERVASARPKRQFKIPKTNAGMRQASRRGGGPR